MEEQQQRTFMKLFESKGNDIRELSITVFIGVITIIFIIIIINPKVKEHCG
uniref:Bm13495 n=1 Tax=Brugia malayi TaxID=6279 RepID=A0A1I9G309_BRUMA|nr:Bm13495 [Brugia malayi]